MLRRNGPIRYSRRRATRRGATMVEMAFALPVLLAIVLFVFEFSYVYMVQHLMQDAAREGCRAASLPRSTNTAVVNSVQQSLQGYGITGVTTSVLVNGVSGNVSTAASGDEIGVRVSLPIASFTVVPGGFLTGTLNAKFTRRRE